MSEKQKRVKTKCQDAYIEEIDKLSKTVDEVKKAYEDISAMQKRYNDEKQDILKSIPADHKIAVKGYWTQCFGLYSAYIGWRCSECGEDAINGELSKYCPNCGAEMQKKEEKRQAKPCPFCNNAELTHSLRHSGGIENPDMHEIYCSKCFAKPGARAYTIDAAIDNWNERNFELYSPEFGSVLLTFKNTKNWKNVIKWGDAD